MLTIDSGDGAACLASVPRLRAVSKATLPEGDTSLFASRRLCGGYHGPFGLDSPETNRSAQTFYNSIDALQESMGTAIEGGSSGR